MRELSRIANPWVEAKNQVKAASLFGLSEGLAENNHDYESNDCCPTGKLHAPDTCACIEKVIMTYDSDG